MTSDPTFPPNQPPVYGPPISDAAFHRNLAKTLDGLNAAAQEQAEDLLYAADVARREAEIKARMPKPATVEGPPTPEVVLRCLALYDYNTRAVDIVHALFPGADKEYASEKVSSLFVNGLLAFSSGLDREHRARLVALALERYRASVEGEGA